MQFEKPISDRTNPTRRPKGGPISYRGIPISHWGKSIRRSKTQSQIRGERISKREIHLRSKNPSQIENPISNRKPPISNRRNPISDRKINLRSNKSYKAPKGRPDLKSRESNLKSQESNLRSKTQSQIAEDEFQNEKSISDRKIHLRSKTQSQIAGNHVHNQEPF